MLQLQAKLAGLHHLVCAVAFPHGVTHRPLQVRLLGSDGLQIGQPCSSKGVSAAALAQAAQRSQRQYLPVSRYAAPPSLSFCSSGVLTVSSVPKPPVATLMKA